MWQDQAICGMNWSQRWSAINFDFNKSSSGIQSETNEKTILSFAI